MSENSANQPKGRQKGIFGDRKKYKMTTVVMALVILAFIIFLVVFGVVRTGSRKNIFTIMAILSVLPFAKLCSILSALLPYRSMTDEQAKGLMACAGDLEVIYDVIFSTEKMVYPIECMMIEEGRVLAYSMAGDKKLSSLPKALKSFLKTKGYGDYTVRVESDYGRFKEKMLQASKVQSRTRTTHLIAESFLNNCV